MGCSFHTSRDNRRFYIIKYASAYRYSHLNWHTFLHYHTLIFQHSATYTCLHPRSQENNGYTCTPTRTSTGTHIHTYTHTEQSEVWSFGWMLLGDLRVSPIWISCKVHITDKMASMTHVRSHWLRLLNQTYCLWHRE